MHTLISAGIRLYAYIILFACSILTIVFTRTRFLKPLSLFGTQAFGFNDIKIFGKVDPTARITVFNHPQCIDGFLLNAFVGPISGLIQDSLALNRVWAYLLDCVIVSATGGQNTTRRMREKLKTSKYRYAIAVNRQGDPGVGGRVPGDQIKTFKTIAFRMGEAVQPMVIVVDDAPYIHISHLLTAPLHSNKRLRVFLLPKMTQRQNETPEEFAARTKKAMNRCLKLAWKYPLTYTPAKPSATLAQIPTTDPASILTSMTFTTMVFHALLRKTPLYAAAWLIKTITSGLTYSTPSHQNSRYVLSDRLITLLIVLLTAIYFTKIKDPNPKTRILPLVCFLAAITIYFTDARSAWIHICSLLGYHICLAKK
jgi:hypothetical protein